MYDSISRGRVAGAQTKIYAECAAALGITIDTFREQVAVEKKAGYTDEDAPDIAFLHIADPGFDLHAPCGARAGDPLEAAAYRRCPRREREANSRRNTAVACLGDDVDWQSQVLGDYQYREPVITDPAVAKLAARVDVSHMEALRRLSIAWYLREQALDRWPATTRRGRRWRAKFMRVRLAALGYWPDLRQQLHLPAPQLPIAVALPRRAPHITSGRIEQRGDAGREQMAFNGELWEVAA